MGDTWLASLSFPSLSETPNVPRDIQELAEDVDRELYRPFPCSSTTRPDDARLRIGTVIYETDTKDVSLWDGDDWVFLFNASAIGGGGPADTHAGRWSNPSTQTIGTSYTVVSVPTEEVATSVVTRQTQGAGHKFVLNEAGIYTIGCNLGFPAGTSGVRSLVLANTSVSTLYDVDLRTTALDAYLRAGVTDRFAAGTELVFAAAVSGAASLNATAGKIRIAKVSA